MVCHSERSQESKFYADASRRMSNNEARSRSKDSRFLTSLRCVRNDSGRSFARSPKARIYSRFGTYAPPVLDSRLRGNDGETSTPSTPSPAGYSAPRAQSSPHGCAAHRRQAAQRVRQDDVRVIGDALDLRHCAGARYKRLRADHRRRQSGLFEGDSVVHTAR